MLVHKLQGNIENGKLEKGTSLNIPAGVTKLGRYALNRVFYCSNITSFNLGDHIIEAGDRSFTSTCYACRNLVSADLHSLKTVSGSQVFDCSFDSCYALTSVDLSGLTTVSGSYAMDRTFGSCSLLTSVDLSGLTTVSGSYAMNQVFYACTGLASISLNSLTSILGSYAFYDIFQRCTSLISVGLPILTTISGSGALSNAFNECSSLPSIEFNSLTSMAVPSVFEYTFQRCTSLTSVSFPALTPSSFGSYTNQFNNMLSGVTGCTVHFPSNLQSVIGSWASVTNGFGGTNTSVLFDLPATTVFNRNSSLDTGSLYGWTDSENNNVYTNTVTPNKDSNVYDNTGTRIDKAIRVCYDNDGKLIVYDKMLPRFVAVANGSGVGAYSTDGITWTSMNMPSSQSWNSVCYGNGKYVAVSKNDEGSSYIAYSTDGINWTNTYTDTLPISSVTYGNNIYVAVSSGSVSSGALAKDTYAYYSTDGVSWTKTTLPKETSGRLAYTVACNSVTFGDKGFLAIGKGPTITATSRSYSSTNGIDWTISDDLPNSAEWVYTTYGNGIYFASSTGYIYQRDGSFSWTSLLGFTSLAISFGNNKFIALHGDTNEGAYSTDGVNWTSMTLPSSGSWSSVCFGNND